MAGGRNRRRVTLAWRATLARQYLLERAPARAIDAIEHLAGMQSQALLGPYVGLWTRLQGFVLDELSAPTEQRHVVRLHLMRNTVHLVSARLPRLARSVPSVAARAEVIYPLEDQFYGERGGRLRDPFGQQWMMSQHVEDVSAEEMARRAAAVFSQ